MECKDCCTGRSAYPKSAFDELEKIFAAKSWHHDAETSCHRIVTILTKFPQLTRRDFRMLQPGNVEEKCFAICKPMFCFVSSKSAIQYYQAFTKVCELSRPYLSDHCFVALLGCAIRKDASASIILCISKAVSPSVLCDSIVIDNCFIANLSLLFSRLTTFNYQSNFDQYQNSNCCLQILLTSISKYSHRQPSQTACNKLLSTSFRKMSRTVIQQTVAVHFHSISETLRAKQNFYLSYVEIDAPQAQILRNYIFPSVTKIICDGCEWTDTGYDTFLDGLTADKSIVKELIAVLPSVVQNSSTFQSINNIMATDSTLEVMDLKLSRFSPKTGLLRNVGTEDGLFFYRTLSKRQYSWNVRIDMEVDDVLPTLSMLPHLKAIHIHDHVVFDVDLSETMVTILEHCPNVEMLKVFKTFNFAQFCARLRYNNSLKVLGMGRESLCREKQKLLLELLRDNPNLALIDIDARSFHEDSKDSAVYIEIRFRLLLNRFSATFLEARDVKTTLPTFIKTLASLFETVEMPAPPETKDDELNVVYMLLMESVHVWIRNIAVKKNTVVDSKANKTQIVSQHQMQRKRKYSVA